MLKTKKNILDQIILEGQKKRPELESDLIDQSFLQTKKDREEFYDSLNSMDCIEKVYRSQGNFILVRMKNGNFSRSDIVEFMLENYAMYIKDVSDKFYDGNIYFRFAVRLPVENELLIVRFEECLRCLIEG
jgi:histidinol-phosphate/aromatic aminotransferase/cobyric acid decarboxylase-like protein